MAIPRHVAIIMDGNGRWAVEHGLPRVEGHRRGSETIEKVVEAARERGIEYLTLYAFSEENWQRPGTEVIGLMQLLKEFLISKRAKMVAEGIRFRTIGDISRLPPDVTEEIHKSVDATIKGNKLHLIVALSYGARQEICRAVNALIEEGNTPVTPDAVASRLYTADIPDPDLLIRTSNEYRISNFLLWQLAYTELYFTSTLWPDFDNAELDKAIEVYSQRERRFGMTSEQIKAVGD
jgi:undecaprenyl diphosphate synthase